MDDSRNIVNIKRVLTFLAIFFLINSGLIDRYLSNYQQKSFKYLLVELILLVFSYILINKFFGILITLNLKIYVSNLLISRYIGYIVLILLVWYQLTFFINSIYKKPIVPIAYSKILSSEKYRGKIFASAVPSEIIFYYSKGPAITTKINPPIDLAGSYYHFNDFNNLKYKYPDFYLCDGTLNSSLIIGQATGGRVDPEFHAQFSGKNCAEIDILMSSLGYLSELVTPNYAIYKKNF
jgi:hypothetical protein